MDTDEEQTDSIALSVHKCISVVQLPFLDSIHPNGLPGRQRASLEHRRIELLQSLHRYAGGFRDFLPCISALDCVAWGRWLPAGGDEGLRRGGRNGGGGRGSAGRRRGA